MGCFTVPCMITKLPILHEEPVRIFLLASNEYENPSICDTLTYFTPMGLPFKGTYNDYGASDDAHGEFLDMTLKLMARYILEMPKEQFRPEISKTNLTIESVFEASHDNRLFLKKRYGFGERNRKVYPIFIKESVYQNILKKYIPYEYGDVSYKDKIYNQVEAWRVSLLDINADPVGKYFNRPRFFEFMASPFWHNFHEIKEELEKLIDNKEEFYKLFDAIYEVELINQFMDATRICWINPPVRGQENETDSYKFLRDMFNQEIKTIDKYWD